MRLLLFFFLLLNVKRKTALRSPIAQNTTPTMPQQFDTTQPPFDLLDPCSRDLLQNSVDLFAFAAGGEILAAEAAAEYAFVIASGLVQAFDTRAHGGERAFADLGPGDLFGSHAVLSGRARHAYRAAEDSSCYRIPAALFRQLVEQQPRFGAWFREGMAIKRQRSASVAETGRALLSPVAQAHPAPLVRVDPACSIADATRKLRERGVDSLVVDDPDLGPGIVTRTDLLEALALRFQRPDAPVGLLANRPLITVDAQAPLFQALVLMTERHVERVVVRQGDQLIGTLGMAEVLANYSSSSHLIVLEINHAVSVAQVADAARRLPDLIESLFNQGAKMRFLAELVTALNGRILRRLYELAVPEELQQRMCLLVLGSEGRGEQFLRTDQDNALVLAEGLSESAVERTAQQLSAAIEACGWPPCPGGVMVKNGAWRGTAQGWSERITCWLATPTPEAMLNLAILVDARAVAGDAGLVGPLNEHILRGLGQEIALRSFADPAVRFHTPLSWFGRIKGGESGTDLKKGAIFPIVHGLRSLALANGVTERNSFRRAEALIRMGQLSEVFGRDLQQALAVCLRLRLAAQLGSATDSRPESARVPDNRIHVEQLRRLDRELLRDALRVVNEFQDHLKQRFHLER